MSQSRWQVPLVPDYEEVHRALESAMKDRKNSTEAISDEALAKIQKQFPGLKWKSPTDSLNVTPSEAAKRVLAARYGVGFDHVEKAIKNARAEQARLLGER